MKESAKYIECFYYRLQNVISNAFQNSPLLGIKVVATVAEILDKTETTAIKGNDDIAARSALGKNYAVTAEIRKSCFKTDLYLRKTVIPEQ